MHEYHRLNFFPESKVKLIGLLLNEMHELLSTHFLPSQKSIGLLVNEMYESFSTQFVTESKIKLNKTTIN